LIYRDNAAFARGRKTIKFLSERDLEKLFIPVPPYSPDMNIIENLWAMACMIWNDIPIDAVNNL